ncbi:MAG TPA: S46 family peptidase [Phenylobacterium sp.]
MNPKYCVAAVAAAFACLSLPARADEGMWTFDNFPAAQVGRAYGVTIDKPWLDRVQAASVRLTTGCSASLVSPEGLVLTNHHCVIECAQDLSTPDSDYVKDGFLPAARTEERQCPGMQAEVLIAITDVTDQLGKAAAGRTGGDYVRTRDAAIASIEQAACGPNQTLERCQVVSLYRGGQYKLYRYRKYVDVRLVFAPEAGIANFGGDPDNFNFPRYDFDMGFLRLYEGGKLVRTPQHLTWVARAPREGEPVFVSGNPGTTGRLLTMAQLQTQRDIALPTGQLQRSELRGRLIRFSQESAEHARIAYDALFSIENAFKVYFGQQAALNDAAFMAAKRSEETALRAKVAADPRLAAEIGDPWAEIEKLNGAYAEHYLRYRQLENDPVVYSDLFEIARTLVRGARERTKPGPERLSEYGEARLPLVERHLLEARSIDPELEEIFIGFWLSKTREYLTVDDPAVTLLLGRESPEGLAKRVVAGSKLADPKVRKTLWEGGMAAIEASDDPMIHLALRADAPARAARSAWETDVSGPTERAAERIARARFAALGDSAYPDATFTLRLSYGKVGGWSYRGRTIPATTDFAGLYRRATGEEPYDLPPRWIAAQTKLNPGTVFNFVSDNDITGGNSGSPVINARAEVLGAAFDGNIHSLGGQFGFDPTINRTVIVSTAGATEALAKVYGRTALLKELGVR